MNQEYLLAPAAPSHIIEKAKPKADARKPLISGRDALAGAAGGVTSVLLGQPFDLIKVRLQTTNSSNVLRVARDVWVHEGPLAFYKGAAIPFLGVGFAVSIQFVTYHSVRQTFEGLQHGQRLSASQSYLAGGAAGIANSLISGPVEHIRTRLQLQSHGTVKLYAGPMDCVKQIVAKAGLPGLFKAYPVAVAREFQAYGCYFAAFEASLRALGEARGKTRKEMTIWDTMPCGALAGIAFWMGSYPIDVVKSKLQGDGFGADARYRNVRAAVVETWQQGGFRGFWRGLSPTLVRTSLSSAGCFAM